MLSKNATKNGIVKRTKMLNQLLMKHLLIGKLSNTSKRMSLFVQNIVLESNVFETKRFKCRR